MLGNGKVLVAGGFDGFSLLSSELYTIGTGTRRLVRVTVVTALLQERGQPQAACHRLVFLTQRRG